MNKTVIALALRAASLALLGTGCASLGASHAKQKFSVVAFYTAKEDEAHISFVREARSWFPAMAAKYSFSFDTTSNWGNLNADFLSRYQVVVFLDTRPEAPEQR